MTRLYSQRMLNPFHGIVNIVEIEGADAVCRDGIHWTLYIQGAKEATELDDGTLEQVSLPDIKLGTWSAAGGLRRAPVRLVTDYDGLDALGGSLLNWVKIGSSQIPFPLQDIYALWLLDGGADGLPLVLLKSSCDPVSPGPVEALRWTAGQVARTSFSTDTGEPEATRTLAADRLAQQVNGAAGPAPRAQWFHRRPHGSGRGLGASAGRAPPT